MIAIALFIIYTASKANYCLAFKHKDRYSIKQIILGRPVNIQSARMEFEYLVQAVDRLAKEVEGDRTFKNAFKLGAAYRLDARILEVIEKLSS